MGAEDTSNILVLFTLSVNLNALKKDMFPLATSLEQAEHKYTTTICSFTEMFFGGAGKRNMKSNKKGI